MQYQKAILAILAGLVFFISVSLTWQQIGYWRNSASIYQHTLQVTKDNFLVNDLLGNLFAEKGDYPAALQEFQKAVRINPNHAGVRNNLGIMLSEKGDLDAAIHEFQTVLRINPNDAKAQKLLSMTLAEKNDGRSSKGKTNPSSDRTQ